MNFFKETYLGNLLQAHSQYFNAWFGGSCDISISGRIGEKVNKQPSNFWIICELLVDTAFYPIQGKGHCQIAYKNDPHEDYRFNKSGTIGLVFLTLLLVLICIPLSIITWGYWLVKRLLWD